MYGALRGLEVCVTIMTLHYKLGTLIYSTPMCIIRIVVIHCETSNKASEGGVGVAQVGIIDLCR